MHNMPRRGAVMAADNKSGTDGLVATLAHHDAAIVNLSSRMTGVESSVKSLSDDVHMGFSSLSSKFDKLDSRPHFDFHTSVRTILSLAVLFSMMVAGIIWVTTGQFGGVVAEQKSFNETMKARVEKHEDTLERISERMPWIAKIDAGRAPR